MKQGALFYPTEDSNGNPVPFDSLFIPYIYKEIYFDGVYIDILNGRKDMTILDIGANIGVVTDHLRSYARKVYSVEPSPEHFAALEQNKKFNNWDNVEVFNLALADKDGKMTLNFNPSNRTCNSLAMDFGQGGTEVQTVAFDTFFNDNKIETVDFCKFDVEGSEDMILRSEGFKNVVDRVKAIEVAFHFPDWIKLAQYMESLGYKGRRYACSEILVLFTR